MIRESLAMVMVTILPGILPGSVVSGELPHSRTALQSIEQLQKVSPTSDQKEFSLALKLERAGNIEQAQAIYHRLFLKNPRDSRYYQKLKELLKNAAQHDSLIIVINQHLRYNPEDVQGFVDLGEAYLQLGSKEEAITSWQATLKRFNHSPVAERLVLNRMLLNNLTEEVERLISALRSTKSDPSYFSLELGSYYTSRMNYDRAADEFLGYLAAFPRSSNIVSGRLLRFPNDAEVIDLLRNKLTAAGTPAAMRILASIQFQNRNFREAYTLYRKVGASPDELFKLGRDITAEGDHATAQQIMEDLLQNPSAGKLYDAALLQLAEIFERRSHEDRITFNAAGFFPQNRFFSLPFIKVEDDQLTLLRRAMTLYDSLRTTTASPFALLRLAEIKYRILDDFDGAISDLQAVLRDRRAAQLRPQALFRLVDSWVAKGDLVKAGEVLADSEKWLESADQYEEHELKRLELLFLGGYRDSLMVEIGGQMALLGSQHAAFNDLMELSNVVKLIGEDEYAYLQFIKSEQLLHQNRRSEALALLMALLEGSPDLAATPLLQYRAAHLSALQGDFQLAEEFEGFLTPESEYSELGLLLSAEIADYLRSNHVLASQRYLQFLDAYPSSIYGEVVRSRYRELNRPGN